MKLTDKELEIMNVLWQSDTLMTAADIIALSPNRTWKETSIHVIMRTLQAKKAVILDSFVPTTGRPSGAYKAALTVEEYALLQVRGFGVNIVSFLEAIMDDECYVDALRKSGWDVKPSDSKD